MTHLGGLSQLQRDELRRELSWLGFYRISQGVYVHPTIDPEKVESMLHDQGVTHQVLIMVASDPPLDACRSLEVAHRSNRELLSAAIHLQSDNEKYAEFVETFLPLLQALRGDGSSSSEIGSACSSASLDADDEQRLDEMAFLVRSLLVHRFRMILLREPEIPAELLPEQAWSIQAREMTRQLYHALFLRADRHFMRVVQADNPAVEALDTNYYLRFK